MNLHIQFAILTRYNTFNWLFWLVPYEYFMQLLNLVDHLFLLLENDTQPMNISGICVFELPSGADDNFVSSLAKKMCATTILPTAPFNQVLSKRLFWAECIDFNIDNHFYHTKLTNASLNEALQYIARNHSVRLDRRKPLWECHIIEGINPKTEQDNPRFIVQLKIHHALADGIAAMRLLSRSLSRSPDEPFFTPFWGVPPKSKNNHISLSLRSILKIQKNSLLPVIRELYQRVKDRHSPEFTSSLDAPTTLFNQKINNSRTICTHSIEKSRFETLAHKHKTTTNDMILAVISGAIRVYLDEQNALPKKSLIGFVPISLRQDGSETGNQLSFLLTNLGTHLDSAKDRITTIKASMNDGKARFRRMTPTEVVNYSLMIYGMFGINLITGMIPKKQAFNLLISNVPNQKEPLYLNGAKLNHVYPASVLLSGQAVNITFVHHQDMVDFGIVACSDVLPNINKLTAYLDKELKKLEADE